MEKKYGIFNYFCIDKNWKKNFLIGSLICCFMYLFSDYPLIDISIFTVVSLFFMGWQTCATNKRTIKQDEGFYDFKRVGHILLVGLKSTVGFLAYGFLLLFSFFILIALFGKLAVPIENYTLSLVASLIFILAIIFLFLLFAYCVFSAYLAFCFDLKLASFFDYKKIRVLLKKGLLPITSVFLKVFALTILMLLLIVITVVVSGVIVISAYLRIKGLGFEAVTEQLINNFISRTYFIYLGPLTFYLTALCAEINADCLRKIISKNTSEEKEN